ncbi:MAG: cold shock domain-containing protein [Pseudomonadota bacterium]
MKYWLKKIQIVEYNSIKFRGEQLQTQVKKWFQDKEYGFLENGKGPDIMVRKTELIKCSYLKVSSIVEFECHIDGQGLIAKKVRLLPKQIKMQNKQINKQRGSRTHPFGVMT